LSINLFNGLAVSWASCKSVPDKLTYFLLIFISECPRVFWSPNALPPPLKYSKAKECLKSYGLILKSSSLLYSSNLSPHELVLSFVPSLL